MPAQHLEKQWGPPGLETPKPPVSFPGGKPLLTMTLFSLATIIGVPFCQQNFGSIDLMTGYRGCGQPPSEIRVWAYHTGTRRAEDAARFGQWIARHPGRINKQYGAFCDTPLHFAAEFGREDFAESLIAAGANVEAQNTLGERPLHVSAAYGHPAVVKRLLAGGADLGAHDRSGKTPLHTAAFGHGGDSNAAARLEVAKLLLAAGADVNAREPGSGFTPLRYATSYTSRNAAMTDLLVRSGADPRGAEEPTPRSAGRDR
jgi:Ankyrin repeats (3 copies)